MSDEIIQVNPLVFGGEGESVHANMLVKLWENPDPTADFAAQNISLSSIDYDFLMINYRYSTSVNRVFTTIIPKNASGVIGEPVIGSSTVIGNPKRIVTGSLTTSINIGDCDFQVASNGGSISSSTNNSVVIPTVIYGFKKSLDITAIVSNVSTDARQCMLSDGVTSVEDRVGDTNVYKFFDDKVVVTKIGNLVTACFYGAESTSFKSGTSFTPTSFLDNYPKLKPTVLSALTMGLLYKDDSNNYPATIEVTTSGKVSISYKNAIGTRTYALSDTSFKIYGTLSWVNE